MKKSLILCVLVLSVAALLTRTVMSQSRPARSTSLINDMETALPQGKVEVKDGRHFHHVPGVGKVPSVLNGTIFASASEPAPLPKLDDQVRNLQRQIEDRLQQMQESKLVPFMKDVELRFALAKYLAEEKLANVLSVLEEVVKECPGTAEAEKATAAIEALRSEPVPSATDIQPTEAQVPLSLVPPAEEQSERFEQ